MNCKHINIVIREETYYRIPQGWEELMEQQDIDMEDYRIGYSHTVHICQDCGKILQEW